MYKKLYKAYYSKKDYKYKMRIDKIFCSHFLY